MTFKARELRAVVGLLAVAPLGLAAVPAAEAAAAVPRSAGRVAVASTSWTSAQHGWVLGSVACATGRCTAVARTTDGGARWTRVGAPAAPLTPSGSQGVREVRFADNRNGWAFATELHVTHDGGRSWRRLPLPGGGKQVGWLATGGGVTYLVVSSCVVGTYSCPRPASLWRTAVGNDTWHPVPVALHAHDDPIVSAFGRTAYVVLQNPSSRHVVFSVSTDGGRSWSARRSPCDVAAGEGLRVAPTGPSSAALLCSASFRPGRWTKRAFYSTDTARTTTYEGSAPIDDVPVDFTASGRVLAVAASGGTSAVQLSIDRGRHWATAFSAESKGMSDIVLVGTLGAVVRGSAADSYGPGDLLLSHDRGHHWRPVPVYARTAKQLSLG